MCNKELSRDAGIFFFCIFVKEDCYRKKQSTKSMQNKIKNKKK